MKPVTRVVCLQSENGKLSVFDILEANIDACEAQNFFGRWVSITDASHIIVTRGWEDDTGFQAWLPGSHEPQPVPRSWRQCQRYHNYKPFRSSGDYAD